MADRYNNGNLREKQQMEYMKSFYLDKEKDIIVDLFRDGEDFHYVLKTPNHNTGNLIRNLAKLCKLPLSEDENGLLVSRGTLPCYIDGYNRTVYVFRLGNTKVANIYPDGTVEMKASSTFHIQDTDVADQGLPSGCLRNDRQDIYPAENANSQQTCIHI